ncbi:MAG: hypothetical protein ACLRZH_15695 [Ruthenibacterium lactatiformans]
MTTMEQNIDRKALIRAAFAAREYAYTPIPISRWARAAGQKRQRLYRLQHRMRTFTLTNCAERTALFKAVSEGGMNLQPLPWWEQRRRAGRRAYHIALRRMPADAVRVWRAGFTGYHGEKRKRLAGNDAGRIAAFGLWPGKVL